jgi:hypothetical protein
MIEVTVDRLVIGARDGEDIVPVVLPTIDVVTLA